jgi:hypothetical protein
MRGLLVPGFLIFAALAFSQAGDRIVPAFGKLVAATDRSITVRNDQGARTFLITSETRIWRGDYVDVRQLRPGDDLAIRFRPANRGSEGTAVDIEANVDRWDGTITKVSGDLVQVELTDEDGKPLGKRVKVTFWSKTTFLVDGVSQRDLKSGAHLEVIGLVTSKSEMRAWRVIGFDPRGIREAR